MKLLIKEVVIEVAVEMWKEILRKGEVTALCLLTYPPGAVGGAQGPTRSGESPLH